MDKRPNLFLIGAAKGGSTSLAVHLKSHPQIAFFAGKEPNIFNQESVAACRKTLQTRLENRKTPLPDVPYFLDASVNYSQYPKFTHVPEHIAAICGPDTPRFLYIMRNPVDRAISQYFWRRERFGESASPEEALSAASQYVQSSQYDLQIEQFLRVFPRASFRFVVFDSYYGDVAGEFSDLCRWLDIDDTYEPDLEKKRGATNKTTTRHARFPVLNRLAQASPALRGLVKSFLSHERQLQLTQTLSRTVPREDVAPDLRLRLAELFAQSIEQTEALTGHDLSAWKTAATR